MNTDNVYGCVIHTDERQNLETLNLIIMNAIINKANEITNENFTKLIKARKNAGACFLIVALATGGSFYGSYTSNAVYYVDEHGEAFGFRR